MRTLRKILLFIGSIALALIGYHFFGLMAACIVGVLGILITLSSR